MKTTPTKLALTENGSSLVELALILPVLFSLLLGVADLADAYYEMNEVTAAAHAAAIFGSQNVTDTSDMQTVAQSAAPDVPGIAATASYGCECADGSGASASCATSPSCSSGLNSVYYVVVTAHATYTPLVPLPRWLLSSYTLSQTVEMRGQD
jgi:Flp pilus assembly protein TadG